MNALEHFADLEDPRSDHALHYPLASLIFLTLAAVVADRTHFTEIADFAEARLHWFQRHGYFLDGRTPSHDILSGLFRRLDPKAFQQCFLDWTTEVCRVSHGELVAIDGKSDAHRPLRRSHDKVLGKKAIHIISAWSSADQVVMAPMKVDDKSNEIVAIPELLALLNLRGAVVSIDAIGCQKDIAEAILEKKADYLLGVKGNQVGLEQQAELLFVHRKPDPSHEDITKGHGRIEMRHCDVIDNPKALASIEGWPALRSIVRIRSQRQILSSGSELSEEIRFYLSSAKADAQGFTTWVKQHWEVENKVHWLLDVNFREDEDRSRKGHADQNMALVRRTVFNICRLFQDPRKSLSRKRKAAAWSEDDLDTLLGVETR
jgi:predicted transposase YbfD/YdcC